ncbi:hypothetical protein BaRGS_00029498 [Batillaria attramentaria]|uniref:Uncharacterized protein n=1 Tax=Batillaria attramentaria TaxID=370345 RepID=A0ABD0JX92_9CAEN
MIFRRQASGVPSPYPPRTYIHYAIRDTEFLFWDSTCLRAVAACGRREGTQARAEDGEGGGRGGGRCGSRRRATVGVLIVFVTRDTQPAPSASR